MSTNFLIQNDFVITPKRRSRSENITHFLDLNYDCLRAIFQHLDLASQFSLLKTSSHFLQIILFDIWYPYYDGIFDISGDKSLYQLSAEFQSEFLKLILRRFAKIKGIPVIIFKSCMDSTVNQQSFEKITSLAIRNSMLSEADNEILDLREFSIFPNLKELHLENVIVKLDKKENFQLNFLRELSLTSFQIVGGDQRKFYQHMFSLNLEKLSLKPFSDVFISFEQLKQISNCFRLKALTVCTCHCLNDARILDYILKLTNLETLTIQSCDNYCFTPKDLVIFNGIMKILNKSPNTTIKSLKINGLPDKGFFESPYLRDVASLQWIAKKIFHRKLDGSIEWKSDMTQIIQSYNNFIRNSKVLQTLFIGDNIFHKDINFADRLQRCRKEKGVANLKIVNDNTREADNETLQLNQIPEGSIWILLGKT